MQNLLITGISAGLGLALVEEYLSQGWQVFGCSRRESPVKHSRLVHQSIDLANLDSIQAAMDILCQDHFKSDNLNSFQFDLVILNAGILGEIRDMVDTPLDDILAIMDVNVWANKRIFDWLAGQPIKVAQVVLISSGAAIYGSRGWAGYALSKATLNMLAKLYARELPETHITPLAPGLIDSAMMAYLCNEPDAEKFDVLQRIRATQGTPDMQPPAVAAKRIAEVIPQLRNYPSGDYLDIRDL